MDQQIRVLVVDDDQPHAEAVAESLDRGTLFSILEMFLRVATPGAKVLEQQGTAAMKIMFPNRAASRKFRSSLGGRLLSAAV